MYALKLLISNHARRVVPGFRSMSSSPLVDIAVNNEGIATVTMQRPPVNSLNLDLLQSLSKAFDEVERNKCNGMILTSSSSTVFSAGLDLTELYKPEKKQIETLWTAMQEVCIKLFGSKFPTAAAINGHAPAGGCVLALCCEYRVMVGGKYTIGLSESHLGLVVNKWIINTLSHTIPQRETELAITRGTLFSVDEALKVGLIDETVSNKAKAVEQCVNFIKKFDRIPPLARGITKQKVREGPLTWMKKNRAQDVQEFTENVTSQHAQQSLEVYINNLKQRKESPKK